MSHEKLVFYQIAIAGLLASDWSDWLNGFEIHAGLDPDGTCITLLTGKIVDQAALRGILNKIWDLNLELIALYRCKEPPDPRFLNFLTHEGG